MEEVSSTEEKEVSSSGGSAQGAEKIRELLIMGVFLIYFHLSFQMLLLDIKQLTGRIGF